jgi:multicomponent Na+:H+ antiporter subunit F
MITWAWVLALLLVGAAVIASTWRASRGPTAADRAVAAEAMFVATVSAIALLAVLLDLPLLLDVALVAVLVGFLTTIGLSHFVDRPEDPS